MKIKNNILLVIITLVVIITGFVFTGCSEEETVTGSISGHAFFSNGDDHAGIIITLERTDNKQTQVAISVSRSTTERYVITASQTTKDGFYTFNGIAPGTYTIYAVSPDSKEKAVAINGVVLNKRGTAIASDMFLTLVGSIIGKVSMNGAVSGNGGVLLNVAGTSYTTVTDDDGSFTINDIPAGNDYQILIIKGSFTSIWANTLQTVISGEITSLNPDTRIITDDEISAFGSLQWQGEYPSASALIESKGNPKPNWAYYNTTDKNSYIWNGVKWDVLAGFGGEAKFEEAHLVILQVYGAGPVANDGGGTHSFVELYNNTNVDINLSGYSLHYANGMERDKAASDSWTKINLSGTIPAKSSYLILGKQMVIPGASIARPGEDNPAHVGRLNLTLITPDIDAPEMALSNRSFQVVLMSNQNDLTMLNPFNTDGNGTKAPGFVDLIGVVNDPSPEGSTRPVRPGQPRDDVDAFKGTIFQPISRWAGTRRVSLIDTDDNQNDFGRMDWRTADLTFFSPRTAGDGNWNPIP